MTIQEAIEARHSVRAYTGQPLATDVVEVLEEKIRELNEKGHLHMQLIRNETKAFQGKLAKYEKFRGVNDYIVMAGQKAAIKREKSQTCLDSSEREQARMQFKADDLDERIGYYGEQLVLLAQTLGLNTCWVGLSYSKVPGTYILEAGEVIEAYISIGYGETQGVSHKIKRVEQVSNANDLTPSWFRQGVEAALLAPTAVNQQKFFFEYIPGRDGKPVQVLAKRNFSLIGYTKMDLGIAKYHFEIGAGKENFEWA